jgi:hypothetical protein
VFVLISGRILADFKLEHYTALKLDHHRGFKLTHYTSVKMQVTGALREV